MSADEPVGLRGLGRKATAPVRNYFNGHFEATKNEIRSAATSGGGLGSSESDAIVELAVVVAETETNQTQVIAQLRDQIDAADHRIAELTARIDELTAAVAALVERDAPAD